MREEIAPAMPDIAKPDFGSSSAPAMFALPAENGSKPAESAPQPEPEPEAPAGRSGGFNTLKAVRNLCKMANITEAEVLGWLEATGKTDGSQGGLDEVPSAVLTALSDGWADKGNTAGAATVIKAARSGKDML